MLLSNLLGEPLGLNDAVHLNYWMNRNRLTTKFLKKGIGTGYSIPATRFRDAGGLHWSDATIQLGWYMGVLATEYYLLSIGQIPIYSGLPEAEITNYAEALANVQNELYFALAALERLDKIAEVSFANPPLCSFTFYDAPGFFIRDDVPTDFQVGKFPFYSSDFALPFQKNLGSEVENWNENKNLVYNKEPSQDQIYHLLLGLALVKKFVHGVVVDNTDLNGKAAEMALRLVQRLESDDWILKNPACDKKVHRGYDARFLSLGSVRVLKEITGIKLNDHSKYGNTWETLRVLDNLNNLSNLLEKSSYSDNLHMVMVLAAVGNGWRSTTTNDLMQIADVYGWYLYPLLHHALFGFDPLDQIYRPLLKESVILMLNEAPPDGPSSFSSANGWRSDNRFLRTKLEQQGMKEDLPAEYNGLDFMLLHNLYQIVKP